MTRLFLKKMTIGLKIDRFIGVLKGKLGQGSRVGYRKLPLKNTGDKMTRWDGTCNSPLGFSTAAHDFLYFEINDS